MQTSKNFALRIDGQSMEPTIMDGDIVIVRQRLAEIKEYSREVLSVEKVKAVINNWKMTNNEEGYNAMINTFVRSVVVYKDNIDVDLYLCIGSNEYTSEKLKKSLAK